MGGLSSFRDERRRAHKGAALAALLSGWVATSSAFATTVSWLLPASGTWGDSTKWSPGVVPNNGFPSAADHYDAIIGAAGVPYSVTIPGDVITLDSLTLNSSSASFNLFNGGTLRVLGALNLQAGTMTIAGSTLRDATLTGPGHFIVNSTATLDNVTLDTDLSLPNSVLGFKTALNVTAGHTLSLAGGQQTLSLSTSQTWGGAGQVVLDGNINFQPNSNWTFTIGPQLTMRTGSGGGHIGASFSTTLNRGTISVQTPGASVFMDGQWANQGTLMLSAGTLTLGGSFTTAGIGTLVRSGGTLAIAGLMNNTGATFAVDATTGNVYSSKVSGQILTQYNGGTITTAGGFQLIGGGTFNNVTLAGDLTVPEASTARSTGTTFVNSHIRLARGDFDFWNAAAVGTAEFLFDDVSFASGVTAFTGSLNLGNGISVRTGVGSGSITSTTIVNNGTISAETSNHGITISSGSFTNFGSLKASNASTLTLGGVDNRGTISAVGGATIDLGAGWGNSTGTISAAGANVVVRSPGTTGAMAIGTSKVYAAGSFTTAQLRTLVTGGNDVIYAAGLGSIDNVGDTMILGDAGGNTWALAGGSINGGAIAAGTLNSLLVAAGTSTLQGVDLHADVNVLGGATLAIVNPPPLDAHAIHLAGVGTNVAVLRTDGTVTLNAGIAGGSILFDGPTSNNRIVSGTGELTLGPALVVRTGTGGGTIGAATGSRIKNQGTIFADAAGQSMLIDGTFTNANVINVKNGASLALLGNWVNNGTINVDNSTLNLGGVLTGSGIGVIERNAGTVNLTGQMSLSGSTFALDATRGSWQINGGSIYNGTLQTLDGTQFTVVGSGSINSSINSGSILIKSGSYLQFNGTWRNDGSISLEAGAKLYLFSPFTKATLGQVDRGSGTILIGSTLDLGTGSFDLGSGTLGGWALVSQGRINGGTLTSSGAVLYTGSGPNLSGGTLNGVSLAAPLHAVVGETTLFNGLQILPGGSVHIDAVDNLNYAAIIARGTQTIAGPGEIIFDGNTSDNYLFPESGSLTIASNVTVRSGTSGGYIGDDGLLTLNLGTISAQTASRAVVLWGATHNLGTCEARNGGVLYPRASILNYNAGTLTGGTWNVYDGSRIDFVFYSAPITTSAADIRIDGATAVFAGLNLQRNVGRISVYGRSLSNNGSLLTNSGTIIVGTGGFLRVSSSLDNSGTIDVSAGMALNYPVGGPSPMAALAGQIRTGYAFGSWTGPGINSSAARLAPIHATGLGAIEASEYHAIFGAAALFMGQSVDDTSVLVKYTYYGDTDLNGIVDFDDYSRTDQGFNNNRSGWLNGDFDYNGIIDFDDYSLIDLAFNTQMGTLHRAMSYLDGSERSDQVMNGPALQAVQDHLNRFGEAYAASFLSAVPEPVSVGATLAICSVCRRRRRSR